MESIESYTTSDLNRALEELNIEGRSRLVRKEDKYDALRKNSWNGLINGRRPELPKRRSPSRKASPRKSPKKFQRRNSDREESLENVLSSSVSKRGSPTSETSLVREKLFGVPEQKKKSSLERLLRGEEESEEVEDQRMRELAVSARLKALLESKVFDTLTGKKKAQAREFIKNALDILNTGSEYPQFTKAMLEKIFIDDQQLKSKGLSAKSSEQLGSKAVDLVKNFLNDLFKNMPCGEKLETNTELFKKEKPLFSDEALLQMIDENIETLKQKVKEVPLFSPDESRVIISEELKRRGFFASIDGAEIVPGNNYPLTVDDLLTSSYNFDRNKGFLLNLSSFISNEPNKSNISSVIGYDGFTDGVDLTQYSTSDLLKIKGAEYQRLFEKKNSEVSGDVSANIRFFLGKIRREYEEQDIDMFRNSVDSIEKLYTLIVQKRIEAVLDDYKKKFNKLKKSFTQQGLNYAAQILLPVYLEVQVLDTFEKKSLYYSSYYKLGEDKINEVIKFFEDNAEMNKKELFDKIVEMFIKTVKDGIETFETELQNKVHLVDPNEEVKVKQINEVVINMILFQQSANMKSRLLIYLSNERLFFDMKLLDSKNTSSEINVNTLVKLFDPESVGKYKTVKGTAYNGIPGANAGQVDLEIRKDQDKVDDLSETSHNRIIMNILLNVAICISKYYSKKIYGPEYAKIIKRYILLAKEQIVPIENELIKSSILDKLNILFNLMYLDRPIPYAEILNKCFNRIEFKPSTSGTALDEETEYTFMLDNVRNILIATSTNIRDYRSGVVVGVPARTLPVSKSKLTSDRLKDIIKNTILKYGIKAITSEATNITNAANVGAGPGAVPAPVVGVMNMGAVLPGGSQNQITGAFSAGLNDHIPQLDIDLTAATNSLNNGETPEQVVLAFMNSSTDEIRTGNPIAAGGSITLMIRDLINAFVAVGAALAPAVAYAVAGAYVAESQNAQGAVPNAARIVVQVRDLLVESVRTAIMTAVETGGNSSVIDVAADAAYDRYKNLSDITIHNGGGAVAGGFNAGAGSLAEYLSDRAAGAAAAKAMANGSTREAALRAGIEAGQAYTNYLTFAGAGPVPNVAQQNKATDEADVAGRYAAIEYDILNKEYPGDAGLNNAVHTAALEAVRQSAKPNPSIASVAITAHVAAEVYMLTGAGAPNREYRVYLAAAAAGNMNKTASVDDMIAEAEKAAIVAIPRIVAAVPLGPNARGVPAAVVEVAIPKITIPKYNPPEQKELLEIDKHRLEFFSDNLKYISLALFDSISSILNSQKILKTVFNNIYSPKMENSYFDLRVSFALTYKLLVDTVFIVSIKVLNYISSFAYDILPELKAGSKNNSGVIFSSRTFTSIRSGADKQNIEILLTMFKNSTILTQVVKESDYYIGQAIKYFKSEIKATKYEEDDKKKFESESVINNLKNKAGVDHIFVSDPDSPNVNVPENVDLFVVVRLLKNLVSTINTLADVDNIQNMLQRIIDDLDNVVSKREFAPPRAEQYLYLSNIGSEDYLDTLNRDYRDLEPLYNKLKSVRPEDNKLIYRYVVNVFMFFISLLRAMQSFKRVVVEKGEIKKK